MCNSLIEYARQKDFLVCVDSDGCAMDSMDIKHFRCFGPSLIREWELEAYEKTILDRWNTINLYSLTRGINRFTGLSLILSEIDKDLMPIAGLPALIHWAENAPSLSNSCLEAEISRLGEGAEKTCLTKALSWSHRVNEGVKALDPALLHPFEGVKEALSLIHNTCDIAIVSSANREAVLEEWERAGLIPCVDLILCQDAGSKADCIGSLIKKGYEKNRVLMIGDAPGDLKAAEQNGVCFYPILVGSEVQSWKQAPEAAVRLAEGRYGDQFQSEQIEAFKKNLSA